jgi:hypothetical protein
MQHKRAVFPGEITGKEQRRIQDHLWRLRFFIPAELGLEELQSRYPDFPSEDDGPWHELVSIHLTDRPATEPTTIQELIERFCRATLDEAAARKRLGLRERLPIE